MPDFKDHSAVLLLLAEAQDAEDDLRDAAREAHLFVDKRDGQWEPYWWEACEGAPRYTFDMVGPVCDQISGMIEQADFDIKINPAGGESTKDESELYDGLIRNIENISNAKHIFNQSARNMITGGIDGWLVKQAFVDDDSFDQDLIIEPIANFIDSVWFDVGSTRQDRSDSKYGFVLQSIPNDEYNTKYPDGSGVSVSDGRSGNAYFNKSDSVIVGQIYYIEKERRKLLKMSSGRILEESEVLSVLDELAEQGETIAETRFREKNIVKSRLFDGSDWLNKEEPTVFSYIPIIPTYGNFKTFESKILYRGAVEKLLDPQRVYNYSKSREISEGALAPRAKYWMTEKQAAGHEDTLATLNTNNDPVQFFNPDGENPGVPQQNGGAAINPGLRSVSDDMRVIVGQSAGLFAANMGDNPGLQSGVAIEKLQFKGDLGARKYFSAQEVAIRHTAKVIVDAIPRVYSSERQVRILREDGSFSMTKVNEPIRDSQTGRLVTVNDLSKGKYDVTCSSGPSFVNRQQETISAMTELMSIDPSIMDIGGDVFLNNVTSPGMSLLAERKRNQLLRSGAIPFNQMTEEEQQMMIEAQQQPQQPDPAAMIAQAELITAQNEKDKTLVDIEEKREKLRLMARREDREDIKLEHSLDNNEFSQFIETQKQMLSAIQTQASTLKILREAIGADAIRTPENMAAYADQAEAVLDSQKKL